MAEDRPHSGTRLSATQIHDNVLESAETEMARPAASLLLSALAAGLVIGFSFLAAGFASHVAPEQYRGAAAAAAYPLGFIFVIVARSELFTENTLDPVIPLLERRNRDTFVKLVRMWALLLIGNLVGALILGWVLAQTPAVPAEFRPALMKVAAETTSGGFGQVLYAGVFAGWLIALLSWVLAATVSTGAQIVLIWLCTAPIAALHFRHSIAGSVEAFFRAAAGDAPWSSMLGSFVVPSVLGNAIGGVLLVALLNYGQEKNRVTARTRPNEREESREQGTSKNVDLGAW
jgi:formate/nitrite transporter FocA (FNT family)